MLNYKQLPKYCCECAHILKPPGVPFWPHPEAECSVLGCMNYVIGCKEIGLCKDYNKDGNCKSFSKKGKDIIENDTKNNCN